MIIYAAMFIIRSTKGDYLNSRTVISEWIELRLRGLMMSPFIPLLEQPFRRPREGDIRIVGVVSVDD